jgi:hypothetical protein
MRHDRGRSHGRIGDVIRRRIFNALAATSLLLFSLIVVLCARSYWRSDVVQCRVRGELLRIESGRGGVWFFVDQTPQPLASVGWASFPNPRYPYCTPVPSRCLGFDFRSQHSTGWVSAIETVRIDQYELTLPLWCPILLTAVLPVMRVWSTVRARRKRGLCPKCGYDMRATPERCPECGRIAAAPAVQSGT